MVTISACPSCSDDEDVAPLSAKFADTYPLNNYNDTEAVANMNGIHSELNGGGENVALKDEVRPWHFIGTGMPQGGGSMQRSMSCLFSKSPQGSSTSASSSEADDEEADGGSGGEPPGAPKEAVALENGSPTKEDSKVDSPPPTYPAQQV